MKKIVVLAFLAFGLQMNAGTVESIVSPHKAHHQEKQYKKIDVSEVSKEALAQIKKHYGNYQISEAAVAADGEYKLVLVKDNMPTTVTFSAQGEMIKILN